MSNPNFQNFRNFLIAPTTVVALSSLLLAGCSEKNPAPTSPPTPSSAKPFNGPECTGLTAKHNPQNPRQVEFDIETLGMDGLPADHYVIDQVRTDYGDGTVDFSRSHEYAKLGTYNVSAAVIPYALPGAPQRDEVPCPRITVEIR